MRRAHAVGLAMAAGAALTLTGCEKPPPGISIFSGMTSLHTDALCWAFDADELAPGQCAEDILQGASEGDNPPVLNVQPGDTVGISVDQSVAAAGWRVVVGQNEQLTDAPLTTSYVRFSLPSVPAQLGSQAIPLRVIAGQGTTPRGVWVVKLQPSSD